MSIQQTTTEIRCLIDFGHFYPIIDTTRAIKPRRAVVMNKCTIPRRKPLKGPRFFAGKDQRAEIKRKIAALLKTELSRPEMYNKLLKKGLLTDTKLVDASYVTFQGMTSEVLKEIYPDKKRRIKKQEVADLFDAGKTRSEIEKILNITPAQAYQALVNSGRITPKTHRK